ncbi:MAG: hypothetical protein R3B06_21310 [Kofleriaceae bacterium]
MDAAAGPGAAGAGLVDDVTSRLERRVCDLAHAFVASPYEFFSEHELHAEFYAACRQAFGRATPREASAPVHLFRHEYNTIGRYRPSRETKRFDRRADLSGTERGGVGSLDFAILERSFVEAHDHLTVVNKDEPRRVRLREWTKAEQRALAAGIEFKMWHAARTMEPQSSDVGALTRGFIADCRKLAHEQPRTSYAIAFTHGADAPPYARMLADGHAEFRERFPSGDLRLAIIARDATHLRGDWRVRDFPNCRRD